MGDNIEANKGPNGEKKPAPSPPGGMVPTQIDVGFYIVREGTQDIGELNVVPDTGTGNQIEHWGLYSSFQSPNATYTSKTWTIAYQGSQMSVSDFLQHLRNIDTPTNPNYQGPIRYIVATCVNTSL